MENKTCTKCSQTKPLNEFRRDNSTKSGYKQPCRKCNNKQCVAWQKKSYQNSPSYRQTKLNYARIYEKLHSKPRAYNLRQTVLRTYGGKCACCGETEPKFLGIDHIYNDGAKHRRELGIKSGNKFYQWLEKNNFPKDRFQLLCHNCNFSKGLYGECPHKKQQ